MSGPRSRGENNRGYLWFFDFGGATVNSRGNGDPRSRMRAFALDWRVSRLQRNNVSIVDSMSVQLETNNTIRSGPLLNIPTQPGIHSQASQSEYITVTVTQNMVSSWSCSRVEATIRVTTDSDIVPVVGKAMQARRALTGALKETPFCHVITA
jgi:hypothetical protein